jgi:hypothetical protein
VVFEIARRMTADAGRLEERALTRLDARASEATFRVLAASFRMAPRRALDRTAPLQPDGSLPEEPWFRGDEKTMTGEAFLERPAGCVQKPGWSPMTLMIEAREIGGALTCSSGGETRTILTWPAGAARFAYYDHKAAAWAQSWPPAREIPDPNLVGVFIDPPSVVIAFVLEDRDRTIAWAVPGATPGPPLTRDAADQGRDNLGLGSSANVP